jgi:transposase
MPRFKSYNYDQNAMVVINYRDQLQPGTFEHAIHLLVDKKLDLSIFNPHYNNEDGGRPAYDPAILLKIILFAYSRGITSSREIQWCCEHNIIFKALSCDTMPHFTTIASFVSSYPDEIEQLFEQVLLVCHKQGLLGNELLAIDGCKMSSDAAKEWSGTFKELEEKQQKIRRRIRYCLKEHRKLDKQEEDYQDKSRRTRQTMDTLESAFDKIDRFLKTQAPRMGQGKRLKEIKSNITDNQSAKMTTSKGTIQGYNGVATVDKKHQIIVDAQVFGHGQEHHTLAPVLTALDDRFKRLNIRQKLFNKNTLVTADTGFANEANMQYLHDNKINAYIPDNQFRSRDPRFETQKDKHGKRHQNKPNAQKRQVIPASEFQFDPIKLTCICPEGNTLSFRGERDSPNGQPTAYFEGKLLQCRHCPIKQKCMHNPKAADHRKGAGRQVSFALSDKRKPSYTDWMKHRVDSEKGKWVYAHRMATVEPVFGNLANKRLDRFSLRSKPKVQSQWQLYCLVHNIEKLKNYGSLGGK